MCPSQATGPWDCFQVMGDTQGLSYLSTSILEREALLFLGGLSEQTGTFISFV